MAPRSKQAARPENQTRLSTGIPGLDQLAGGGLIEHSLTLLKGDTGTGKTLAGLQFLHAGAKAGEPGIYLSFNEDKEAVYAHARNFGWDFEALEEERKFALVRYQSQEVARVVEEGGGTIRDLAESMDAKRLVMDSLSSYLLVFETPYKENEGLLELFRMLKSWNCTSLLIADSGLSHGRGACAERASVLADGVIEFHYSRHPSGTRSRLLEIVKMRDSAHSDKLAQFSISRSGITVRQAGKAAGLE